MTQSHSSPTGLWLPLVTPFKNGTVDVPSLERLLRHMLTQPIDGVILAATSGEGFALDANELSLITTTARRLIDEHGNEQPLFLGVPGSDTRSAARTIAQTSDWPIDGYLANCPTYCRPAQDGLQAHFTALANETDRPVILYNIPYRTGVNMLNETVLRLAEQPNIVGIKDCCANAAQSCELMRDAPAGFSVMTGEDPLLYTAMTHGAAGAILTAAHVLATPYTDVCQKLATGDQPGALEAWQQIAHLPPLLFAAPSPAPVKHWLWRLGLIDSPELRLPMTGLPPAIAAKIDQVIGV